MYLWKFYAASCNQCQLMVVTMADIVRRMMSRLKGYTGNTRKGQPIIALTCGWYVIVRVCFFFCFNWVLVYRYQILGMRHNQICYILATSTCTAGHCKINHIPQNCSAMTETSQKQTRNNQNPVPLPWLSSSVEYEFIGCGWAIAGPVSRSLLPLSTARQSLTLTRPSAY